MTDPKYAAFIAVDPFFNIVQQGLPVSSMATTILVRTRLHAGAGRIRTVWPAVGKSALWMRDVAVRRWKAQSAAFLYKVCVKRTSGPSGSPMSAQCSTSWFQLLGTLIVGSFSQGWEFVT